MNRKLTLVPAIVALAFSASACMPLAMEVPTVTNVPMIATFDDPQAPGPVVCDEGYTLNEFGDCKNTEAPQAPGPEVNCDEGYTLNEFGDCKIAEAPQADPPVRSSTDPVTP